MAALLEEVELEEKAAVDNKKKGGKDKGGKETKKKKRESRRLKGINKKGNQHDRRRVSLRSRAIPEASKLLYPPIVPPHRSCYYLFLLAELP